MTTTHPTQRHQHRRIGAPGRIVAGLGVGALLCTVSALSAVSASADSSASAKWAAGASASTGATPAPLLGMSSDGVIANQYVVVLKNKTGLQAAGLAGSSSSTLVSDAVAKSRKLGATVHHQYSHALRGYSATLTPAELTKIRADPAVDYVEADQKVTEAGTTEPGAPWGLDRIDQRSLPLSSKYYYTGTGAGVTAYVVDTGIRSTHLDFTTDTSGNTIPSRVTDGVDEVGDGGLSSCDPNADPDAGHGTHVAGTIGGEYYGVAKGVQLVSVRVLDCSGSSTDTADGSDSAIAGLDWIAANHTTGPAVANLSLTTVSGTSSAIDDAVNGVINDGVTVVVAAGNGNSQGQGVSACSVSPSDVKAAITVGASTISDKRATFSNYGSCVDLYAPGQDVDSDWFTADNAAAQLSGTSMATPHVTGAVALYLQKHPLASPATVQKAIIAAATPNKVTNVSSAWPRRLLFALQPVTAPAATTTASKITSGTALLSGKTICSPNTLYCLTQRASDGKLVLQKPGSRTIWSASGTGAAWTTVNTSGNLVSSDQYGQTIWQSHTSGGPSTLTVQDTGNVVLTNSSAAQAWATNTTQKRKAPAQSKNLLSWLSSGMALYRSGHQLRSPNKTFTLALHSNGDLVLTKKLSATKSKTIWHTGAKDDDWLTLLSNGNLVLYCSDGTVMWNTGTAGKGAATFILRDSGNLTVTRLSDRKTLWSSKTAGA